MSKDDQNKFGADFHEVINKYIHEIFSSNNTHQELAKDHKEILFPDVQTPKVTLVMCSDSRVQINAIDSTPTNDIFVIRNIGNQITTCEGSVEFGIHYLKTPILLIVGHSKCGAVAASLEEHGSYSGSLRRELDSLSVAGAKTISHGAAINVHNQVDYVAEKFREQVESGTLIIYGLMYDFSNDFNYGHGKLIIINRNGERDPAKIAVAKELAGVDKIQVGL
ncbi:MAG: carbonic anhydrase [Rickettsiaceae bacterium]|nr:carbonic anhydrase [Rickettsiaceae bacterium]